MDESTFQPEAFGFGPEDRYRCQLAGPEQTRQLGAELAGRFEAGGFIGLCGNLGAGKTTLVRGLVGALGPEVGVSSPSYTLINVYRTTPPVVHVDLYRLESEPDLASTGYWDYAGQSEAIVCVEWLDRIPAAWPGQGVVVELVYDNDARGANLWGRGAQAQRVEAIVETMEARG